MMSNKKTYQKIKTNRNNYYKIKTKILKYAHISKTIILLSEQRANEGVGPLDELCAMFS